MKNNVHKPGRRPIHQNPEFYIEILKRYENHSLRSLAEFYNVSPTTISNWIKKGEVITTSDRRGKFEEREEAQAAQ